MRCSRLLPLLLTAALAAAPLAAPAQAVSADPQTAQALPPSPPDDTVVNEPAARLSDVEGTVRLSDRTGKLFDHALVNMAVLPGMTVETGDDGRAELEFPDGSIARVAPNSSLAWPASSDHAARLTLAPETGLVYFELVPGSSYGIQVGPLVAHTVREQPSILRVNLDDTPYQAAVLSGSVHFEDASGNAAYDLPANETAKIDPSAATNYDIVQSVAPDTWDQWNSDRDSTRAQMATAAPANGGSTGPGWDDLNYYGSWYDVPGAGMAWAPDGVDANFDPYGSGAWGYYTSVGYGWVSAYPWGWLPYHCGLWNYYPTYGWMWSPANCGWGLNAGYGYGYGYYGSGYGWYPYSPVRNAPSNYRSPRRPLPPGGILRHPPASQALIAVQRGPQVNFRPLGGLRPTSRTLVVAGNPVKPIPPSPAAARPAYNTLVNQGGYRTTREGTPAGLQGGVPARSGFISTPGLRTVTPPPSMVQRPPIAPTYVPAPRISAPPPRMVAPAPAPAPMPSAPHAAAAPSGGGHPH